MRSWLKLDLLEKSKQGVAIALSLPENNSSKIKDKIFNQLLIEQLSDENGIGELILLLDKHLGKDDLSDAFDKCMDFEKTTLEHKSL